MKSPPIRWFTAYFPAISTFPTALSRCSLAECSAAGLLGAGLLFGAADRPVLGGITCRHPVMTRFFCIAGYRFVTGGTMKGEGGA